MPPLSPEESRQKKTRGAHRGKGEKGGGGEKKKKKSTRKKKKKKQKKKHAPSTTQRKGELRGLFFFKRQQGRRIRDEAGPFWPLRGHMWPLLPSACQIWRGPSLEAVFHREGALTRLFCPRVPENGWGDPTWPPPFASLFGEKGVESDRSPSSRLLSPQNASPYQTLVLSTLFQTHPLCGLIARIKNVFFDDLTLKFEHDSPSHVRDAFLLWPKEIYLPIVSVGDGKREDCSFVGGDIVRGE